MTEAKKEKERIRKQRCRENLKENPAKYNKYLENKGLRKIFSNLMKSQKSLASSSSNSQTPKASGIRAAEEVSRETTRPVLQNESAFSTKQSRSRSLKKAADHLPESPRKKVEIIQSLASKYQIRIKMHENRGHPRKEISEEKKDWMIEFLRKSNMTYINPGRQDNVYAGKVDGERKYLPRQYLLWTLKDLLDMINRNELHSFNFVSTFMENLNFSQLYNFIRSHKQFDHNKNIPHTSCLCDPCDNIVLLAKGLNNYQRPTALARLSETPHNIVEKYSCSSDDKDCMFDDCTECSSGKLCQLPDSNPDSESDLDSNSDSDTSCLVSFCY